MNKEDIIIYHSEKAFLSEETRTNNLENKAEKFIAVIAVIIGLQLIDVNKLIFTGKCQIVLSSWIAVAALISFGVAIVVALLSRRVQDYVGYPRGLSLIEELSGEDVENMDAQLAIARMYLLAHDLNAQLNDKRAGLLSLSGYFLVSGFLFAILSQVIYRII